MTLKYIHVSFLAQYSFTNNKIVNYPTPNVDLVSLYDI